MPAKAPVPPWTTRPGVQCHVGGPPQRLEAAKVPPPVPPSLPVYKAPPVGILSGPPSPAVLGAPEAARPLPLGGQQQPPQYDVWEPELSDAALAAWRAEQARQGEQ